MDLKKILLYARELAKCTVRFFGGLSCRDFEYDFCRQVVGKRLSILDVEGGVNYLATFLLNGGILLLFTMFVSVRNATQIRRVFEAIL